MNLSGNWQVRIREIVYKQLARFPVKDRERLLRAIDGLSANPFIGDIQKMGGEENVWRRRIGSYRIRYEIYVQERVIYVFFVERRTSKTY
ncbi:MAG: hypothetical protein A3I89_01220 [Candidatus Harrisonbacteria bacterium RIFCSPLOWO2_02_FULL_41_11]|uniref:Plasmid stabilization protein n=1 Tax=Candidatus Harrisonbacteria bacterium RIFCSPHIGHO2_02_FULL_42_16 TaxID=1798404 RepID=A0A1G1ZI76_9BACT|nr:MAG: hypothetical protein A3B92_00710 [Candidatus Harrisonbacteria bacterium RIFCSPHIGHO2_02_FULL_42_16]OGY67592.1 MAG: hypothetical protein A3I89_01220 [Candidatus Harrisonbacteria bacterium RIFCSPLOWO2_02_FULL_41_11]